MIAGSFGLLEFGVEIEMMQHVVSRAVVRTPLKNVDCRLGSGG